MLAYDTENTVKAVKEIYQKVNRPNAFIKIAGTPEGLPAIEKSIKEGIPVDVTLLFLPEQYVDSADAKPYQVYLKFLDELRTLPTSGMR